MAEITFPTPDGKLSGYLATPIGTGPWPGVVVIHEVFGLDDDVRQQADRLASAGYLALAPDLYSWGPKARCLVVTMRAALSGQGRAFSDLEAARAWLGAREECTGTTGVIGFCLGGGFALLLAPRPGWAVAAPNYGQVPKDAETALAGACPVVASYGAKDRQLRGQAQRLESALTALDVPHDVKEYPEAGHGFLNRHNAGPLVYAMRVAGIGYHHPSAEDAWRRILAFFSEHLVS